MIIDQIRFIFYTHNIVLTSMTPALNIQKMLNQRINNLELYEKYLKKTLP